MYDNPCTLPTYCHHPPRDFEVAMRKLLLARKQVTPQLLVFDIPSGASVQLYKQAQLKFSCADYETFGIILHSHVYMQRSDWDAVT